MPFTIDKSYYTFSTKFNKTHSNYNFLQIFEISFEISNFTSDIWNLSATDVDVDGKVITNSKTLL